MSTEQNNSEAKRNILCPEFTEIKHGVLGGWMNKNQWIRDLNRVSVQRSRQSGTLTHDRSMQETWSRGIHKNMCLQPVWGVLCLPDHPSHPWCRGRPNFKREATSLMFVIMYVLWVCFYMDSLFPMSSISNS